MGLFLLSFFLIYGGFHFYFFLKIRAAFAPGVAAQTLLIALLLLGMMTPIIVRASERYGLEVVARLVSWTGYLWMAMILLFFSVALLLEFYRLFVHLAGLIFRTDVGALLPSARTLFLIPALAA
ncbi:MAG: metallophosphoesterase, partial [Proteobacteria bacterium]|nr:metallophosphoesterase [Pseudomonadota bacterium]